MNNFFFGQDKDESQESVKAATSFVIFLLDLRNFGESLSGPLRSLFFLFFFSVLCPGFIVFLIIFGVIT